MVVRQIIQKVVMGRSQIQSSKAIDTNKEETEETEQIHMLILPYNRNLGDRVLRNLNR